MLKRILLMMIISSVTFVARSQKMTNPNGLVIDTVTNTTPEGPKLYVPGTKTTLSITLAVTKISGTIAGNVRWQGSNDPAGGAASFGTISSTALGDSTQGYTFSEQDKRYLWYRALIEQSGTSSASYSAYLYTTVGK